MIPHQFSDLWTANDAAEVWCAEVNVAMHSEICAVPIERLQAERELLRPLPSLRPEFGVQPVSRKVDKLSCIRFGSAPLLGAVSADRSAGHRPAPWNTWISGGGRSGWTGVIVRSGAAETFVIPAAY